MRNNHAFVLKDTGEQIQVIEGIRGPIVNYTRTITSLSGKQKKHSFFHKLSSGMYLASVSGRPYAPLSKSKVRRIDTHTLRTGAFFRGTPVYLS